MPTSWCARWRATANTRKRKRAAFASKVARLLILKDVEAQQNDAGSVSPSSALVWLSWLNSSTSSSVFSNVGISMGFEMCAFMPACWSLETFREQYRIEDMKTAELPQTLGLSAYVAKGNASCSPC